MRFRSIALSVLRGAAGIRGRPVKARRRHDIGVSNKQLRLRAQHHCAELVILGTGSAVPEKVLSNEDLSKFVDTSDAWIVYAAALLSDTWSRRGSRFRFGLEAGRRACQAAGISPAEIDCVICATISADMTLPSCAVFVQRKIGRAAPSGF